MIGLMRWMIILVKMSSVAESFPDIATIWFPNNDGGKFETATNYQDNLSIESPKQCGVDEILYPDQVGFWVCDCKPGYVYYTTKRRCFSAFRRGPCAQNEYLNLAENSKTPECVLNPCKRENFIIFCGICQQLNDPGICSNDGRNVLGVDKNLNISCIKADEIIQPTTVDCPIGGIRWTKGQCSTQ